MTTAGVHGNGPNLADDDVERQHERQHSALRVEIAELRGVIGSCLPAQRTDRHRSLIAVLVGRLTERLRTHFALEEERFLAAIGEAERLRCDHVAIASEAARLIDALRTALAPPDVEVRTLHWLDFVHAHERTEEALEQRAHDHRPGRRA